MPDEQNASSEIEERLRIISELASIYASSASITPDGSMTIEWVTGALTQITGYNTEDLNETGWEIIVHPDDLPIVSEAIQQLIAGHGTTPEFRIITKEGAVRWLRSYTRALWDDQQGRVVRIYAAAQDITEQRITEEQLRRREIELTDFIENAALGLHWVGPDGTILWANRAELELLGYSQEEYIGRNIAEFHADQDAIREILRKLSNRETLHNYEARLRCKDGSIRHVLISSNVMWEDDRFIHTRCFTRDITDRKRAEREREELLAREQAARKAAEEASRAKDILLATVSHELRTPLNAIAGWIGMLRRGYTDKETMARALEVIERNTKSQTQLVDDLLDISRITTGNLRLDVGPVELPPVIQAAIEAVRPAAEAKQIRLQTVLDPKAGPVSGDASRLQQIVWNLLSNAIKFTPREGRVQVRLQRINSHVEITVSDTGQGFSQEFSPYLFESFRQADNTITRSQGGLGLGLAIVRNLTELHGGSVSAFSGEEGQGATFTVKLPIMIVHEMRHLQPRSYEQMASASSESLESECPPSLKGLRLLVVEDAPDARDLLKLMLEKCEAEVKAVESVSEALAALEQWEPDLLVSDIEMPGEDGYSLIRKIRSMEARQGGRVPAVALTAHARTKDRMSALRAGFDAHVAKPFELEELITVIGSLARRSGRM